MIDAKNALAVAISIALIAVVIDNVPTLKNSMDGLFNGVSFDVPNIKPAQTARFPVKADAGLLSEPFSVQADLIDSIKADSKNVSLIFDDRRITINPAVIEDVVIGSYSGKVFSGAANYSLKFDGNAKSVTSTLITLSADRSVKIYGNITSNSVTLSGVTGGTIIISNAAGNVIYNKTSSLSLLGDNVKISRFNGDVSIGSYGVVLDGTAMALEIKGKGKTVTIG